MRALRTPIPNTTGLRYPLKVSPAGFRTLEELIRPHGTHAFWTHSAVANRHEELLPIEPGIPGVAKR